MAVSQAAKVLRAGTEVHAPSVVGTHHGLTDLQDVHITSYNLELEDDHGFVGDRASQTAFRAVLEQWRSRHRAQGLKDPFGKVPSARLRKKALDKVLGKRDASPAADLLQGAMEDFALELVYVLERFLRQKSWRGVRRVVIGGGFPESDVGERVVLMAGLLCRAAGLPCELARLRHEVDDGGLIGWAHLAPSHVMAHHDALLAVDLGGTNARCGVVRFRRDEAGDLSAAKVQRSVKWRHADDDPSRTKLVDGLAGILSEMVAWAHRRKIRLAPFIGVGCPGLIRADGTIARGAQNLPGDWASDPFHLPTALRDRMPEIGRQATQVLVHNDAVVQGLSELPFMRDTKRWAILTIGTGLGNASYLNRSRPRRAAKA